LSIGLSTGLSTGLSIDLSVSSSIDLSIRHHMAGPSHLLLHLERPPVEVARTVEAAGARSAAPTVLCKTREPGSRFAQASTGHHHLLFVDANHTSNSTHQTGGRS